MSSRIRSNLPIGIAALAGLMLAAGSAGAQGVQTQKLMVKAFIGELCTVTAASLDFGSGINTGLSTEGTGSIEIDCASPTNVSVDLDGGLNPGTGASRQMTGEGPNLGYALYKTAPGTDGWEPGQPVTQMIDGAGSVPVFGLIPGQGNGRSGLFTDEVTITLSF